MALLAVLLTVLALPVALIAWTAQSLARNRSRAKATGFPYLVRWVSPINPFWLLYGSSFVRLCSRLGFASKNFTRIYSYGWEANERAKIHLDYGDIFMVAHPGGIQLCVSNAETIHEILQRRADFTRNMEEFAVLNVYGKNLSTTDGQEWQQHRKMTTVTFTEKNDELVWQRSLAQANGILEYWTQRAEEPIRSTHQDTKIFTLNVLAAVLFNKVYPFEGQAEVTLERHIGDTSYQYRESLSTILASIIHILIFGEQGLKAWWTPESWKKAAASMASFRAYIFGLMDNERVYITEGKSENQHLVARLVRACEDQLVDDNASISTDKDKSRRMTLTKEEILSNLFVYAFAGNDTTAIALTNIIIHLAANPETQGWISEEINYYLNDDTTSWNYGNFSKLKRCAAVVMESLRICHPLSQLVKTTNSTPQPLKFAGNTYVIPAETSIHCSLPALHSHPRYWGANPLSWNPRRFISPTLPITPSPSHDQTSAHSFETETLAPDTSENFIPFAWGQRVCPGKRFAQVELVAILAVLFREWRVEPVPEHGETLEQAMDRAWKASLVVDHQGHMLHEMVEPEKVGLRWVKRTI